MMDFQDMPAWARDCSFENYDVSFNDDAVLADELRAAATARKWIGLCSPQTGRGKTHLALGAARVAAEAGAMKLCGFQMIHDDNAVCPSYHRGCQKYHRSVEVHERRPDFDRWIFIRGDKLTNALAMAGISFEEKLEYYSTHNLIIDEFGRNIADKARSDLLYTLVCEMYDRGSIIIATIPYLRAAMPFDASILDRMKEGFIRDLPAGKSYRRPL